MPVENSKVRVILVLLVAFVLVGGSLAFWMHHRKGGVSGGTASVSSAPSIKSIPGVGDPSELYVKTQQQQNALLVKQAKSEGTSSVPTITRPSFIGNLEQFQGAQDGSCPMNVNGITVEPTPGSCTVDNLKLARESGVRAQELRCQACSCPPMKEAGYTASDLKAAGFTAKSLRDCGFTLADLVTAGFAAAELKDAGFSAKELKAAGFTAAQLRAAGFGTADLKAAGFSADELKAAGFSAADLKAAGFSASELKAAGFSGDELKVAGFSAAELKAVSFSAAALKDAGFTDDELKAAGVSAQEIAQLNAKAACSIDNLKKARAQGWSAADLVNKGCSLAALKAAGFTAAELRAAGFSAADLKAAGFSAAELKAAGFSAADLKNAGFSAADLKNAGFSAADLKNAGFSASDLKDAGFSASDLKNAGFDAAALKAAGFNAAQLKAAGFSATDLKGAGFSAAELQQAGYNATDLKKAGFTPAQLLAAGYTSGDLLRAGFNPSQIGFGAGGAGACSVEALQKARASKVNPAELRAQGCSLESMRAAGFTAAELKAAGFSAEQLKAAGFSAKQLKDAGFSAAQLKAAGFNSGDLKDIGFSAAQLKAAAFSSEDLNNAGFTKEHLKAAGFSDAEVNGLNNSQACSVENIKLARTQGVTAADLRSQGCSLASLKEAGFSQGELGAAGLGSSVLPQGAHVGRPNFGASGGLPSFDQNSPQAQLARIQEMQARQASLQQQQNMVQTLQAQMAGQANQLLTGWSDSSSQAYQEAIENLAGPGSVGGASGAAAGGADAAANGPVIKAGTIMFGVLMTSVDSDEVSPILARIVSGPLTGATLLGQFTRVNKALLISFKTINLTNYHKTVNINAVAIDPNTARTAVSGSVNNHYMLRYGTLFASSFLSGIGNALMTSGSTSTGGGIFGSTTTHTDLNPTQQVLIGLGSVGTQYGTVMSNNFNKPPTIKIQSGTGVGLLLMGDLTLPTDLQVQS